MDFGRTSFIQDMQFDDAGLVIAPVRWYFAEPTAIPFPFATRFGNDYFLDHVTCGTGTGLRWDSQPVYDKGTPPVGLPGNGAYCGPDDWWQNGVPSTAPPIALDPQLRGLCCGGNNTFPESGEVKISGAWQRCQQWRTAAPTSGRSLVRLLTSTTWTPVVNTATEFDCTDPVTPAHKIRTSAGATCLNNLATTVILVIGATFTTLTLQSYDRTTQVGIWRLPTTSAFYPGEYFALTIPT